MKVFLTGGTGYIGSAVALALHRAGHSVLGLARSEQSAQRLLDKGVLVHRGDLSQLKRLIDAADECGAVVYASADRDAAKTDPLAVDVILDTLAGTGKPFIYTAGVWDIGDTGGKLLDETAPANPLPLVAWRPGLTQTIVDAASRDIQSSVILPAYVYGNGGGIPAMLTNSAREEGAARLVGTGGNHWGFVHVNDLADLYVRCLQAPPGTKLIGVAGKPYTALEIAEAASRGAGADGKVLLWPVEEARGVLGGFADALAADIQVRGDRARKLLGWQPIGPTIIDDLESGSYVQKA